MNHLEHSLETLMRLAQHQLMQINLEVERNRADQAALLHQQNALNNMGIRESQLYTALQGMTPVHPVFLKNIALRQKSLRQRLTVLKDQSNHLQTQMLHVYAKIKRYEEIMEIKKRQDRQVQNREERKTLDELSQQLFFRKQEHV